jgi:hypothetical protein
MDTVARLLPFSSEKMMTLLPLLRKNDDVASSALVKKK